MDMLLQIGLSNAVAALALALLAFVVRCLCRRPALVHSLWLLVLLKLVTPPFVLIPMLPSPAAEPAPTFTPPDVPLPAVDPDEAARILQSLPPATEMPVPEAARAEPEANAPAEAPTRSLAWPTIVLACWAVGSLLWLIVTAGRIQRFRHCMRQAQPAGDDICQQVRGLATQLRLGRCPQVWLVPGPLSPMLFALAGKPRLLLPTGLWSRLSDEQRQTLLIHELAHYRRRDHWVRLLELLATGLYWWHPVVWWARHELRAAEEECCDAWVIWALPAAAQAYATALMETVDFLSEARPLCPPVASGIGHLHALKRRLTMIMRGTTPRALSWTGVLAVLGLGLLLLPWLPTWAQAPPEDAKTDKGPYSVDYGLPLADQPPLANFHKVFDARNENCSSCHGGGLHAGADTMALHDDLVRWLGQVDRDRQKVRRAEQALQDARQHLQENEKHLQDALQRFRKATGTLQKAPPPPVKKSWADAMFYSAPAVVSDGGRIIFPFLMTNNTGHHVHIAHARTNNGAVRVTVPRQDLGPGEEQLILAKIDGSRFLGHKELRVYVDFDKPNSASAVLRMDPNSVERPSSAVAPKVARPPVKDDQQRRLQQMQKQLDELRKEIDTMRRQPAGTPVPPAPTQQPQQPPFRLVPEGKVPPSADPFKDKYYAPTIPLRPGDPNQATAKRLLDMGTYYDRSDNPNTARYYYELLQKRFPTSPEAAFVPNKLRKQPVDPAGK